MYTNLTWLFPRDDSRPVCGHLWDTLRAKGNHNTIFYLKSKRIKVWSTDQWQRQQPLGLLSRSTEPESMFISVCIVEYETLIHRTLLVKRYQVFFWTESTCLTVNPPLDEFLAPVFPVLYSCTKTHIEIHLLSNLGRLKLCSSLDKEKVKLDNVPIQPLKFNF